MLTCHVLHILCFGHHWSGPSFWLKAGSKWAGCSRLCPTRFFLYLFMSLVSDKQSHSISNETFSESSVAMACLSTELLSHRGGLRQWAISQADEVLIHKWVLLLGGYGYGLSCEHWVCVKALQVKIKAAYFCIVIFLLKENWNIFIICLNQYKRYQSSFKIFFWIHIFAHGFG